ncbi:MAG: Holliday junction DNA helicase RuvA [Candidatus Buchananbacteria bacterium RIFCSPHIGHO2_01_FULL_39_14]|uniref:Holliday junction branch migration complex subunit RuvA n=2 Tax=Candidatus Buchananiibacteriota TaxID=1817903 RepID=A0A1G1YVU5_9BACT|nr:MAG: Holliday junction DNA helicase RuvA [Candidatus Buchananbacteria bacterium RIFCSPHIGHO2_01_FULL_39_14]OGY49153.1 MAG: Holliday junction DNA helicase RuvA [Candidatus Buchananbacteria bacterium RIFCSPHIGHO2_02_FULL_39_17]OGY55886.1 MAG: Holliday junction DNA helicase RuvA [Candidatus Buchananbacteria bacterium RIFCSPLOWO2_01_FULL_40_23b]
MIASLKGTIIYKTSELRKDAYFIIDIAGVGYKVFSPVSNLKKIKEGDGITVYTYLSVSENAMDLYGFLDQADKTFFTLLLDVPGIGPKTAMSILEKTTMSEVQQAIFADNPVMLVKMSGLSQKTAEKIILALKDKVESLTSRSKSKTTDKTRQTDLDAFEALTGFGYSSAEARKALTQVDKKITETGKIVREALRILGKK